MRLLPLGYYAILNFNGGRGSRTLSICLQGKSAFRCIYPRNCFSSLPSICNCFSCFVTVFLHCPQFCNVFLALQFWSGERELNPHVFRRQVLKLLRLPIPPSPVELLLVRAEGLEPSSSWLEAKRSSIRSYARIFNFSDGRYFLGLRPYPLRGPDTEPKNWRTRVNISNSGLKFGSLGEIRTLNILLLRQAPLPIGLRDHYSKSGKRDSNSHKHDSESCAYANSAIAG